MTINALRKTIADDYAEIARHYGYDYAAGWKSALEHLVRRLQEEESK